MDLDHYLDQCIEREGSDVHLSVGAPVALRVNGRLEFVGDSPVNAEDTAKIIEKVVPDYLMEHLEKHGGADFAFSYKTGERFRASAFRQEGHYCLALRLLPSRFRSFEEIGLPPSVKNLLYLNRGLVLVTGPTGSGKTTTLATMLNIINEKRDCHIVTIEDPIEYQHKHKSCIVTQRDVGTDVPTFSEAVIKSLRQDPDVILVGEMRDLATMQAAITAAETGHLVFSTLHTTGAARTVDRILEAFPSDEQDQIRMQLSICLSAVISQILIPKASGDGRVAAFEVMLTTPAISNLIREKKTYRIDSEIQTGIRYGMKTLDTHLYELANAGTVTNEDAIARAFDSDQLTNKLGNNKK